jgi:hypothetical protein
MSANKAEGAGVKLCMCDNGSCLLCGNKSLKAGMYINHPPFKLELPFPVVSSILWHQSFQEVLRGFHLCDSEGAKTIPMDPVKKAKCAPPPPHPNDQSFIACLFGVSQGMLCIEELY